MEKTSQNPRGSRNVLTAIQAMDIFRLKAESALGLKSDAIPRSNAKRVAKLYGISSKTVKDIWMGKTWYRATHFLDPNRADAIQRLGKRPGRPKGAKDRKPRRLSSKSGQRTSSKETVIASDTTLQPKRPDQNHSGVFHTLCHPDRSSGAERLAGNDGIRDVFCASTHLQLHRAITNDAFDSHLKATNQSFDDPFHNDWPFWPSDPRFEK